MSKILVKESVGGDYTGQSYSINKKSNVFVKVGKNTNYFSIELFKMVFLPEGFPHTVSNDYIHYQIWDTIQAFCSSLSGALAARAVLESIGVGNENATVYGATLTWLIKDGTGMVGRILFAWQNGPYLDSNSKMWRLYADVLNDLSFFVDLLAPFFPSSLTIYIISFSGLLKSIVGVAGGATRSALTQHQARNNNLADVSAKDQSQETMVNLVALLLNIILLSIVKDSTALIWPLFILFVTGHIFANYKAVKSLVIETFNFNRFGILARNYFENGIILDPKTVNNTEPVLYTIRRHFNVKFGCRLDHLKNLNIDFNRFEREKYFIEFDFKRSKAHVLIHKNCADINLLRCLFEIELVDYLLSISTSKLKDQNMIELKEHINDNKNYSACAFEKQLTVAADKKFEGFIEKIKSRNWSLNYFQFSIDKFRYSL